MMPQFSPHVRQREARGVNTASGLREDASQRSGGTLDIATSDAGVVDEYSLPANGVGIPTRSSIASGFDRSAP